MASHIEVVLDGRGHGHSQQRRVLDTGGAATDTGGAPVVAPGVVATTTDDPADYFDDEEINSDRWLDTEIAVGSIVAILVLAALVAVWISCRRRRRRRREADDEPRAESVAAETKADRVVPHVHVIHEVAKKISSMKPPAVKVEQTGGDTKAPANGYANGSGKGNGHAGSVDDRPSGSDPALSPEATSAWEPYLLGLPGQKATRARRRSVSLRSSEGDAGSEDGERVVSRTPSPSRGPSPSLCPSDASDAEPVRKRSVTFNAMVEEVQILGN